MSTAAIFTATPSSGGGGGSGSGINYGCTDKNALNYDVFASGNPALCIYPKTTPTTPTSPTPSLGTPGACAANQIITQNLRAPSRNGKYNSYTKGIVKEAKILQAHLNRLGFNSGKEDGIIGPISTGAIKRLQTFLGTKADGLIGPKTRALLNNSCGK